MHIPRELFAWTHVAAGITALGIGVLPMLARKGGGNHRRWGKIYFWAMFTIFITALALQFYRLSIFLVFIAVLSFYLAFTGYRTLFRKRPQQVTWLDWTGAIVALVGGLSSVVWGVTSLLGIFPFGFALFGTPTFSVLGIGFGLGLSSLARKDIQIFAHPPQEKNWWWFYHMQRMLGSYIAAMTAFAVQSVSPHLPVAYSWVPWVAPGLIGGTLVSLWVNHYRQQFSRRAEQPLERMAFGARVEG